MNLREQIEAHREKIQNEYEKVPGVEYNIGKRWEEGIEHHPKSYELYKRIAEVDYVWCNDSFCWKSGGDGDNGEALMYLLDIIFDEDESS